MRGKSVFRYLLRFTLGLAAGSLLFETYLKIAEATPVGRVLPVAEVAPYGPDENTGYAHRPGVRGMWITENRAHLEINALGLRDRLDRSASKPAQSKRFAIVGDSIVEALQVPLEATFEMLAEEMINRGGKTAEVINLGLAGATPAVIVERLKAQAPRLGLDGAVVTVAVGEFVSQKPDNASEYPGFVQASSGQAIISHAFRDSAGFHFRTSSSGQLIYAAIDRVRLALVLNNRKNAGVISELPQAPARRRPSGACRDTTLETVEGVFGGKPHDFASARTDAFLAHLREISRTQHVPIVLAVRDLTTRCPENGHLQDRAADAARARIEAAGLTFVDVDAAVRVRIGDQPRRELFGFGAHIGQGHLNEYGHRVFADVFGEAIRRELIDGR